MRQMYTMEEKYVIKISAYTKQKISSNMCLQEAQYLTSSVDTEERGQLENQQQVEMYFCNCICCDLLAILSCIKENLHMLVWYAVRMLVVHVLLFQDISSTLKSLDARLTALFDRQKLLDHKDNKLRQEKKELLERGNRRRQLESKIAVKYDR